MIYLVYNDDKGLAEKPELLKYYWLYIKLIDITERHELNLSSGNNNNYGFVKENIGYTVKDMHNIYAEILLSLISLC
jgi:hypothetical protein